MTNIVLAAALAISPADFAQLTNRIDILWADHTNRIERIERIRSMRKGLPNRNGPPNRPFRINEAGRRNPK